jgi:hypothetical protein
MGLERVPDGLCGLLASVLYVNMICSCHSCTLSCEDRELQNLITSRHHHYPRQHSQSYRPTRRPFESLGTSVASRHHKHASESRLGLIRMQRAQERRKRLKMEYILYIGAA